jgi:hypothetical protein
MSQAPKPPHHMEASGSLHLCLHHLSPLLLLPPLLLLAFPSLLCPHLPPHLMPLQSRTRAMAATLPLALLLPARAGLAQTRQASATAPQPLCWLGLHAPASTQADLCPHRVRCRQQGASHSSSLLLPLLLFAHGWHLHQCSTTPLHLPPALRLWVPQLLGWLVLTQQVLM